MIKKKKEKKENENEEFYSTHDRLEQYISSAEANLPLLDNNMFKTEINQVKVDWESLLVESNQNENIQELS